MNPEKLDLARSVERAYSRIRADIARTPLAAAGLLSRISGADVSVKWENRQVTGSFKLRGALAKVRSLTSNEKKVGLISASTGNHGLGIVQACRIEGVSLILYLPRSASSEKIAKLRRAGADLRFRGESCDQAEKRARADADQLGRVYVSPYNDPEVIAGQGTLGLEILEDMPDVDDILVPVGGGGLVAGIAGFAKSRRPGIRVFGVEPASSAFMKASLAAGRIVEIREGKTAADAVAGGIEAGSITFPLCRRYVDGILTVGERRLAFALGILVRDLGEAVEPAGALPLAALLKFPAEFRRRRVVLVASGGNISSSALGKRGRLPAFDPSGRNG
jgi:threonine dehydratase